MNIPKLTFPTWEQMQTLDLEAYDTFSFIVFGTEHLWLDGRISIKNEYDADNNLITHFFFDVLERGYTNTNEYTMMQDFTVDGYKKICDHAQYVYNQIITDLINNTITNWREWINEYCTNS